jgi:hypothetical protein
MRKMKFNDLCNRIKQTDSADLPTEEPREQDAQTRAMFAIGIQLERGLR